MAGPNVSFGVVVEINQKPVALMADRAALDNIKQNGLDLNLPGPIDLGQIGKDIKKLDAIIQGVVPDAPGLPDTSSLPDQIQKILNSISTLDVSVDDFRIHIPPPGGNMQDLRYALRVAAEWDKPEKLGPITVKGFAFGVESDPPPVKPT